MAPNMLVSLPVQEAWVDMDVNFCLVDLFPTLNMLGS